MCTVKDFILELNTIYLSIYLPCSYHTLSVKEITVSFG